MLDVSPINIVKSCSIPAFFISAKDDKISLPSRVKQLYEGYNCDLKVLEVVEGEHAHDRPFETILKGIEFFRNSRKLFLERSMIDTYKEEDKTNIISTSLKPFFISKNHD